MKAKLFAHHHLSRLIGMRAVYTGLFFSDDTKREARGVSLFSTTDRHEALTLWNKAKGANHGQGYIQFRITFVVIEEASKPKARRKNLEQVEAFDEKGNVIGRVPAGVPPSDGVRPAVAVASIDSLTDPSATGTGTAVRHKVLRQEGKFDLNDMIGRK